MKKEEGISPAAINALVDGNIENFIAASTPGGIERQEAAGQRTFVASETLPSSMGVNGRAVLEAAGVQFGEVVVGDPLFINASLPNGWKKIATDHSMWSRLVDDKGRERASIFYKAAFYDRNAALSVSTRYSVDAGYSGDNVVAVKDGNQRIHELGVGGDYDAKYALREQTEAWLDEKYPDWRNPAAYWD